VKTVNRPVVVFVDDLDRCESKYVVEFLEGIQTLFREAPITYVVAADRPPPAGRMPLPGSAPDSSKGAPTDPDAPVLGIRFLAFTVLLPFLSATVVLTRLLMTLSSSRVSQWQFRKPTPPLATHRLPRVGFHAFRRYYEGATTSSVLFDGLIAFGHQYLSVLSSLAQCRRIKCNGALYLGHVTK
jgi:KAP family P-loop domain